MVECLKLLSFIKTENFSGFIAATATKIAINDINNISMSTVTIVYTHKKTVSIIPIYVSMSTQIDPHFIRTWQYLLHLPNSYSDTLGEVPKNTTFINYS